MAGKWLDYVLKKSDIKKIIILVLLLSALFGFVIVRFIVKQNTENLAIMNNTTRMSIQITELNSIFRLKKSVLNEYMATPIKVNLEAYDKAWAEYNNLSKNISKNLVAGKTTELFLEMTKVSRAYDEIFYKNIVPKMDDNLRVDAEVDKVYANRLDAEYEEVYRYVKNLLELEMAKSIQQYKSFLEMTIGMIIVLFLSMIIILMTIFSSIRYKNLLNRKEDELNSAMRELMNKEKLASLGILVSGISHEINTPLGNAILSTSFIRERFESLKEDIQKNQLGKSEFIKYLNEMEGTLHLIEISLNRAAKLVMSFKKLAVNQNIVDEFVSFNMYECLSETLLTLKHEYEKKGHEVQFICPKDINLIGNPGIYTQILTNFIMNSIIHGFRENAKGKMIIELSLRKDTLMFVYSDNGVGVSEDIKNKIFDPFFTTNRENGGSGLGLNIVYNLVVEGLNGDIKCESRKGEGIKFLIQVPLKKEESK